MNLVLDLRYASLAFHCILLHSGSEIGFESLFSLKGFIDSSIEMMDVVYLKCVILCCAGVCSS